VKIDPAVTQNLGVRLATVTRIPLATQIEATGVIGFNERNVAVVQTRSSGFVERVWPLAPGDVVKAGQPLVELLVPEWTSAQHELFSVKTSRDETLIAAARERLRLLGMTEESIREVEQSGAVRSRFTINAPIAGVIQALDVRDGMTIVAGQSVARINGLNTVWLEAAVAEMFADAIHIGATAQVHLAGFPEQLFKGHVTAILPALNDATRTLRVRIELPNRDGKFKPGLSAQVTLTGSSKESALAVPTEAVIRTGKRALVMIAADQNRFTPVEVTLGREVGNQTVIATGLSEGQQVVASGQFLIDSESSLKGIEARGAHTGGHL
jgi:Cu(I)/Ag(I) efflux system membrane fusion protein